ncbi:MAG: hypothetical protein JNL79_05555 [Myxococcales bacterium]|nr:hypothetical protein [Myxococcales bacterium]
MGRLVVPVLVALTGACASAHEPSEPPPPSPSADAILAHLATVPAFAGHLGQGGARPLAGAWTTVSPEDLDVTVVAGGAHLASALDPDLALTVAPERTGGTPEVRGAATVLRDAAPATDVVLVTERTRFEEVRLLRGPSAATTTRYRLVPGKAIASLRLVDGRVEAVDASGRVRLESAPAFAIDARGVRRDLSARLDVSGGNATLTLTLDPTGLAYPIAVDPLWTLVPDLSVPRHLHGAAPIAGGKALVAGGMSAGAPISRLMTAFVFDGATRKWTAAPNMFGPQDSFQTTVLSSGKILTSGGNDGDLPNRSVDVFDPAVGTWSDGGSHGTPYRCDVVSALSGDRALCISGTDASGYVWTLSTKAFVLSGALTVAHAGHTATTVSGDRVLVVGGASKTVDLWDPTTKTFGAGGTLGAARQNHSATVLPSGKVLFVGGSGLSTAELYDPDTKTFSPAGAMSTVRTGHRAVVYAGSRLLVVGGVDGGGAVLSTTEIYDGATNTWAVGAPMATARKEHTATAIGNGRVLVVGGTDGTKFLSTSELFEAVADGGACAKATECASGFCVDGVCCNAACGGQCEACDVAGSVGTCSPVSGAPHGARTACVAAGTGVCARMCDGKDRTKCNFATTTVECAAANCAAGTATTASNCDGSGSCPTPKSTTCAPYACGGATCKTTCALDADCGGANVCDKPSGKCIAAVEAKCSADGTRSEPTDGSPATVCSPYLCDPSKGRCAERCGSSRDCAAGFACDTGTGVCNPTATDGGNDGGGCQTGAPVSPVSGVGLVAGALAALGGRLRRRGR